jgi:hypothetical protein
MNRIEWFSKFNNIVLHFNWKYGGTALKKGLVPNNILTSVTVIINLSHLLNMIEVQLHWNDTYNPIESYILNNKNVKDI